MTVFPDGFETLLASSVGREDAAVVLDALQAPPSVSLRLNPAKLTECLFPDAEPVPWSPYGYLLKERPVFTLDPLFHAGCYYVQDSSAMFVGHIFRQILPQLSPGAAVLDLCAAPGGKSTDLAASLRERFIPLPELPGWEELNQRNLGALLSPEWIRLPEDAAAVCFNIYEDTGDFLNIGTETGGKENERCGMGFSGGGDCCNLGPGWQPDCKSRPETGDGYQVGGIPC